MGGLSGHQLRESLPDHQPEHPEPEEHWLGRSHLVFAPSRWRTDPAGAGRRSTLNLATGVGSRSSPIAISEARAPHFATIAPDLVAYGLNDKISSVRIPSGRVVGGLSGHQLRESLPNHHAKHLRSPQYRLGRSDLVFAARRALEFQILDSRFQHFRFSFRSPAEPCARRRDRYSGTSSRRDRPRLPPRRRFAPSISKPAAGRQSRARR